MRTRARAHKRTPLDPSVVERARLLLEQHHQSEVARRLNISRQSVSRIANGSMPCEKHPNQRKLTDEQVAEIRQLVSSRKMSQRKAAIEYGVSKRTVAGILSGELYATPTKQNGFPAKTPPRFEIVSVRPAPTTQEIQAGRAYSLFPLKQRSA